MWNKKGIIVSCQANIGDPLHGPHFMAEIAKAVVKGGAIGIRANGVTDVAFIKQCVNVPIIGILKKNYPGYLPYITPTLEDALAVSYAGADIIAMDCTKSPRPDGSTVSEIVRVLHEKTNCKVMADIATIEEAMFAYESGVDYVGTTLFGYTEETKHLKQPCFSLMKELVEKLPIPIIAEGGVNHPELVKKAFETGVSWVVIGRTITSPKFLTERFVKAIDGE
ncbi:N-acetylmannosamine-6-phosphate 2-epimerase [Bacillus salipaludis]|uniref:Putative N-acetylmannosamine-6-phosphate 2-epimerase n=1 Tax=Bacillus salipaludis TaxID=2547811 RepID=A0ABW8RKG8_9BACI